MILISALIYELRVFENKVEFRPLGFHLEYRVIETYYFCV